MRWKKANHIKRLKLYGRRFSAADLRCFIICNRFAASEKGNLSIHEGFFLSETFREEFYQLKDRLLEAYGKPKGYALQYWTSAASDWRADIYLKDGAHHYHILESIGLGGRVFHRPTNHFYYSNDVDDYYKKTIGYESMSKLCKEKIEGKKSITQNIPKTVDALSALKSLQRRYAKLLEQPPKPKKRPRVITGYYEDDCFTMRLKALPNDRAAKKQCHFCLQIKDIFDIENIDGHDICNDCSKIVFSTGSFK